MLQPSRDAVINIFAISGRKWVDGVCDGTPLALGPSATPDDEEAAPSQKV